MPLDLSWETPPPGVHDAVIDDVDFKFGAVISIIIDYRTSHRGDDYVVREWLTIDAPKGGPDYFRTAEGKGRLKQLYDAQKLPLPERLEPSEIRSALIGKAYRIAVTSRVVNGLATPKIAGILGPGAAPAPTKAAEADDEVEP